MRYRCYRCDSEDGVVLCIIQFIPGSAGVIRPVCEACRATSDPAAAAGASPSPPENK